VSEAVCERMIGTLRRELFDRLLIVNEHHLRRVMAEYLLYYSTYRRTAPWASYHRLCDPDVVAARIKCADRRPKGWDLDLSLIRMT
jgi:hypothetical protein